jgi:hypothetical protein
MEDRVAEPKLEDYVRQVLVRGLQPVGVELVEPNPAWPARYQRYAATLHDELVATSGSSGTSLPRSWATPGGTAPPIWQ